MLVRTPRLLAAAAWFAISAAQAALQAGDTAPPFEAPAALAGRDSTFRLPEALSRGPVVLYFYPAAFTSGCSLQAHAFAERIEAFRAAGASVVGISLDGIERLHAFSADPQSCAGRFLLASDAGGAIARRYALQLSDTEAGRLNQRGEAIGHARAERSTFVIGRDGRIAAVIGGVSPEANVIRALQAVQALPPSPVSPTARSTP